MSILEKLNKAIMEKDGVATGELVHTSLVECGVNNGEDGR